jgi:signal transduction histidine kinase
MRREVWESRAVGMLPRVLPRPDLDLVVPRVLAVVCVAYRMFATMTTMIPYLWMVDSRQFLLVLTIMASMVANFGMLGVCWRNVSQDHDLSTQALIIDSLAAGGALWAFRIITDPSGNSFVGWAIVSGTVAIWTSCRGMLFGFVGVVSTTSLAVLAMSVAGAKSAQLWNMIETLPEASSAVLVVGSFCYILRRGLELSGDTGKRSERARAQRLIHDTALQALEAIALTADPHSGCADKKLSQVGEIARAEARRLREALHRDELFEAELAPVLELTRDVGRERGLEVKLAVDAIVEVRARTEVAMATFDAVCEALTNVVKHAKSYQVWVSAVPVGDTVRLSITDHGCGFDPDSLVEGFGIKESIRGRLSAVGGHVVLDSSPGHGAVVTLWVPIETPKPTKPDQLWVTDKPRRNITVGLP